MNIIVSSCIGHIHDEFGDVDASVFFLLESFVRIDINLVMGVVCHVLPLVYISCILVVACFSLVSLHHPQQSYDCVAFSNRKAEWYNMLFK
jgi:hypothetical protein